jgi:hypothetical protein
MWFSFYVYSIGFWFDVLRGSDFGVDFRGYQAKRCKGQEAKQSRERAKGESESASTS